ncbi:MAG: hypothetical protein U9Q21_02485 [Candidatus Auribacterota bacterium]|nr:hypothetical protein [Candidatus Auribacterota bacterium]
MDNKEVLRRLEEMQEARYDIQFAAMFSSLKDDLKKEIEQAEPERCPATGRARCVTNKDGMKMVCVNARICKNFGMYSTKQAEPEKK